MGELSSEVFQSLGKYPRIVPRVPRIPREPDSGISSARSTTTVPWSQAEPEVNPPLPILELPAASQYDNENGKAEHQF